MGEIARRELTGLKFFEPLRRFRDELHRQKEHPNRNLHLDEHLLLLLLAYFNPAITGLRQLVKLPELPVVDRNLGLQHTSLGSFSEASSVFDPEPLRRIFLELSQEARVENGPRRPQGLPADLCILAADATLWQLLPRMTPLFFQKPRSRAPKPALKGHFVFNVLDQVPVEARFGERECDDRQVLPLQLGSGALYVLDRGYQSAQLYQEILRADNSFVARQRRDVAFSILEERALTESAVKSGVSADQRVHLGAENAGVERELRIVRATVECPPSRNLDPKHKRGKHAAPGKNPTTHELILLTDRFDLDASDVVAIYKYRWQIEVFFRWFKCVLKCRHLFAESPNGMALQMYAALIASLLVVIYTQRKPTKMLLWLLQLYVQGQAEWSHVEKELAKSKTSAA